MRSDDLSLGLIRLIYSILLELGHRQQQDTVETAVAFETRLCADRMNNLPSLASSVPTPLLSAALHRMAQKKSDKSDNSIC